MRRALLLALTLLSNVGCGEASDQPLPLLWVSQGGVRAPATLGRNVFFTEAVANGTARAQVVVDTGAPVSILAPNAFDGEVPDGVGVVATLTIGGITLSRVPTVGLRLLDGRLNGSPLGGLLGYSAFGQFAMSFNYRDREVAFGGKQLPADVEPTPTSIPFTLAGGGLGSIGDSLVGIPKSRVIVSAVVEGAPVRFMVDSGASTVAIRQGLFDSITVDGRATVTEAITLTTGSAVGEVTRLRSVSVGGLEVTDLIAIASSDLEPLFDGVSQETAESLDGLIGGTFLREFNTIFDYPARRLELRRYATRDHVADEFRRVGIELDALAEDPPFSYRVDRIFPGTDAALQAIRPGERVLAIDGVSLDSVDPFAADSLLLGPVGGTRTLDLENRQLVVRIDEILP